MFEVSDMRSWLMAGSAGTEEMKGTLIEIEIELRWLVYWIKFEDVY